jgi:hypothetical protein
MDTSKGPYAQIHPIDDLPGEESELDDAVIAALPRVNGVDSLVDSDEGGSGSEDEDSNEEWEMDSLFEDTLEEMGDDMLFKGGEKSETPFQTFRAHSDYRTQCLHARRGGRVQATTTSHWPGRILQEDC